MLLLGWQADNTFEACTIEATTPPGVLVTSPGGPAIGTGSNWALPQAPLELGPLTVNGVYDFSIYCRDTYTASLQFQLGSDPAISGPSMLLLATSVNDTVEATAVDSVSAKESTTTDVPVSSPVELNWIAYNVQPGTCLLGGPGVTEASEVGSTTVAVSGPADQEFTFACMGTDFVSRSVSSTLHPTP
jgi:hypothetical protein